MNVHAIINPEPEFLTLSDFDQCMLLTEDTIRPIALRGLYESVASHPRFRNTVLSWKKFLELLEVWVARYPGSKTMACMWELNETKEWAYRTYQRNIPEMLDALMQSIAPISAFSNAIEDIIRLNHRFGIVTHSHRQLVWGMAEHMRFSHCMSEKDIFDIVDLQNDGKYTGIGWMRVMEHFFGGKMDIHRYKARNWMDDCLKNHRLPGLTGFRRFYINPTEPFTDPTLESCDSFTKAMGIIAQSTTMREAA